MNAKFRRAAQWGLLLAGFLALGQIASGIVPRDNVLTFSIPRGSELRRLDVEIRTADDQVLRMVTLYPQFRRAPRLEHVLSVPPGQYKLDLTYEIRSADFDDKNQGGGWTRLGLQHQIRLEGEDHRIPPPDHEAK